MSTPEPIELPTGFTVGHWTDRKAWTGCTVVLAPEGAVAAAEVRGGGPGTRESDLLSPAAGVAGVDAILFAGGSAHGLAAADGVARWLRERGRGFPTPAGRVPLVSAAVLYDLMLGKAASPGPVDGYAACSAAGSVVERGSVGAGTGATVGKLLGPGHWTKGGLGAAAVNIAGARLVALAAVNPVGDVIGPDVGPVAAAWHAGSYHRTVDLLRAGGRFDISAREATTLVAVLTDAVLDKRQAWLVARAAAAGVARAVEPCALPVDGDFAACLTTGRVPAPDPLVLAALAADVVTSAIRDAVMTATAAPGCPAAADRR